MGSEIIKSKRRYLWAGLTIAHFHNMNLCNCLSDFRVEVAFLYIGILCKINFPLTLNYEYGA